jgi:hypothetical protein
MTGAWNANAVCLPRQRVLPGFPTTSPVQEVFVVSIINNIVICGSVLILAFLILLALPKSMLRCVLLEVLGWLGTVLACVYVVSPIDVIPDFIPVLGWIDDGGVLVGGIASAITAICARSDRKSL